MAADSVLDYDDIVDIRYNPFTEVYTPLQIGYGVNPVEVRTVPTAAPYHIKLFECPQENVPSTTDISDTATSTALEEVSITTTPAANQYRVKYDGIGGGIVEFNSAQAGVQMDIKYYGLGHILQKLSLDTRVPSSGDTTIAGNKTFTGDITGNIVNNYSSAAQLLVTSGVGGQEFILHRSISCYFEAPAGGALQLKQNGAWRNIVSLTGVEYGIILTPGHYQCTLGGGGTDLYISGVYGEDSVANTSNIVTLI